MEATSFSFLFSVSWLVFFTFLTKTFCSLVFALLEYLQSFILRYKCMVLLKFISECSHLTQFLFLVHSCHVDSTSSWKFLVPIPCDADVAFDLYSQVPLSLYLGLYNASKKLNVTGHLFKCLYLNIYFSASVCCNNGIINRETFLWLLHCRPCTSRAAVILLT